MAKSPTSQPALPPGHGGIMVRMPPDEAPGWLRTLRTQVFRVGRKRWRAAHPVTFLTAPAGLRRLQLRIPAGRGDLVAVRASIDVYPGQWRQLTIGEGLYTPPVFDEHGVNVNTATMPSRRRTVILGLLGFLVMFGGFAAACLLGPRILDWLGV